MAMRSLFPIVPISTSYSFPSPSTAAASDRLLTPPQGSDFFDSTSPATLDRLVDGNRKLLRDLSTFGIGGPCSFFLESSRPAHLLCAARLARARSLPLLILGRGSNCLFSDRGFDGLVVHNRFSSASAGDGDGVEVVGFGRVRAWSGYPFNRLGVQTAAEGWGGLEFAGGIPGTVGGAAFMNAGANGQETAEVVESVEVVTREGGVRILGRDDVRFGYRWSSLQDMQDLAAIIAVTFRLRPAPAARDRQREFLDSSYIMEKNSTKVGGRTERSYMHWTSEMDITLSNALLEQHSLGHKTPNGWKSVALTAAITALKDICGVETSKEKLTARLKTWNKYYIEVSAMLDTSGFGWDWERNMVKVDSEEVWANYVKAHPSVKHYKDKVIVNWSDLAVLCGTDRATGSHAATATEATKEIDAESMAEKTTNTQEQTRVEGEGSSRRRRKRAVGNDAVAVAIDKLADSVQGAVGTMSTSDVDDIYVALTQMTDLEDHDLLRAMDILCHDSVKRDIFKRLPDKLKGTWLQMQFER